MSPDSAWKNLIGLGNMVSQVNVDEIVEYTLRCIYKSMRSSVSYELVDTDGKVIDQRSMDFKFNKNKMNLSILPSYPLEYLIGLTDKRYFVTPDEKIPTYYETSGSSRSLSVDGMKFQHHDYQSIMHFSCPDDRFVQAVMVASLLFCPPMQDANS